jgi:hypothetical protein
MAKTFSYTDVLSVVGKSLPKALEDQFSSLAANVGTNLIWYGFDWRESMKTLPPFYLLANEQDHNIPLAIVPSDFHGLRKCQIARYTQGAISKFELFIAKDLLLTHLKAIPHSISYEPTASGFRLFPRVPANIGAPEWFVEGTYKARPAKITNATLNTILPFDDMYFNVMVEAIRWAFLMLSGSPQAGQVQMQSGQIIYSGQLATVMAAIEQMATQEGVNNGDVRIYPESALVPGSGPMINTYSGLFGLYG